MPYVPLQPGPPLGQPGSLLPYQFLYNGLLMGPGTSFGINKIEGLADLPTMRSSDFTRPRDHGEFQGIDLLAGRDVTVEFFVTAPPGYSSLQAALLDLATALTTPLPAFPGATTESALVFQLPGGLDQMQVNVRPRKRAVPIDVPYSSSQIATATAMFHATDPRVYSSTVQSFTIPLPTPAGGLTFPLTFPISFGALANVQAILAHNGGNFETRPVAFISGPCVNPRISNDSTGQQLQFNLTLQPTDTLVVYFDSHAVLLNPTSTDPGASRRASLVNGSSWWTFPPGTTQVSFHSRDNIPTGAQLTLQWQSAYQI